MPHILHTETLKQRPESQSTAVSFLVLSLQHYWIFFFFPKHKGFSSRHDFMVGLGCAVLLVRAISDRSAICRPLPLFFVDRVVTMHCRLFSLTLVTCQLRHSTHSKNCVILGRECRSRQKKKNLFSLLKILLQVWNHCSQKADVNHCRRKQSNLLRSAVKRERREAPQGSINHRALDNTTLHFNLSCPSFVSLSLLTGRKWGRNKESAYFHLCIKALLDFSGGNGSTHLCNT